MHVELPYGNHSLFLDLDAGSRVALLEPRRGSADPIRLALAAPIGSPRLREIARAGQSVVIVTSDITRPCPSHLMLPPVLEELAAAGVCDEAITVVLATGTHRPHTDQERLALVGDAVARRVRCIDSDPTRTVLVGTTRRGTPVEIFEPVVHADLRVVMGNVEPHYFAGYSGGAKAIVPGVCSAETICRNHALMIEPLARAGVLDGNPVREDIEEGAALLGIDFMLNVILDHERNVVVAAAGHPVEAHRWACRMVEHLSMSPVHQLADVVIVSAGGHPKDINLYQAQKALENAAAAVRPGGIIIWVAECQEGLGNQTFEQWLVGADADEILARIQEDFVLGGHKAAAIARVLKLADVMLISELPADLVRRSGMEPFASVEAALAEAVARCGPHVTITVMPEGASVMPVATRIAVPTT